MNKDFDISVNENGQVVIKDTTTKKLNSMELENEIFKVDEDMRYLKIQADAIQKDWNMLQKKKEQLEKIKLDMSAEEEEPSGDTLFENME